MKLSRYFISMFLIAALLCMFSPVLQPWRLQIFACFFPTTDSISLISSTQEQKECDALRAQVTTLTWKLLQNEEKIKSLTQFRERFDEDTFPLVIPANILARKDASTIRRLFVIDRGERDGVTLGACVIFGYTLLGKVIEVRNRTSKVVHITDPTMRIEVMLIGISQKEIHHDGKDYGQGVCVGQSQEYCMLKFVPKGYEKWHDREVGCLTVGNETDYPPGLLVGTLLSPYEKAPHNLSQPTKEAGLFWDLKINILDLDQIHTVLVLNGKR